MARVLKLRLAEGMAAGTALIGLVLFLSGLGGRFMAGIVLLCVVGLEGFVLSVYLNMRTKKLYKGGADRRKGSREPGKPDVNLAAELTSPYYIVLTLIFLGSLVLYYGDFIWHVDEFHLYALSPKYMLETGKLPMSAGYIGGAKDVLAGSLFHLFFQKFTGYNEGMMYVSSSLLTWIGLLLPFAFTCGRKQAAGAGFGGSGRVSRCPANRGGNVWAGLLLYIAILHVGIYSLYVYGTKNLYVDLPAIAWAAGLAGWYLTSSGGLSGLIDCGISEVIFILVVLGMVGFFKPHIGLLLAVLAVLFLVTEEMRKFYFEEAECTDGSAGSGFPGGGHALRGEMSVEKPVKGTKPAGRPRWKIWLPAGALLIVLGIFACLAFAWNAGGGPGGMVRFFGNAASSLREKAKPVTIAYITAVIGSPLSNVSELKLTLPSMSLVILAIFLIGADLKRERRRGIV